MHRAKNLRNSHPLYKANFKFESAISYLENRRVEIESQWEEAMKNTSWWNQLMHSGSLDFRELDNNLRELRFAQQALLGKHADNFDKLNDYYMERAHQAIQRIEKSKIDAEEYIKRCKYDDEVGNDLLKKGFFLSSLSVPISIWSDLNSAGDIYDVLRSVNSNYASMSDVEIWWESLFLSSESLAGLISLTKGAYLESLVSQDSGGKLFEHFNHPDTDIVIDGLSFQIKATDSVGYIDSVADGIPIIATTEVANLTDAIDSGYSNEELQEAVSLAIGGEVIDVGDTAVDAILTGVGGLGLFATIQGINHATEKYENGGDPVEAAFEGIGVAIEGTARAAVNTLEMGYKVLNSRPSRFVGRGVLKLIIAVDEKLMDSGKKD